MNAFSTKQYKNIHEQNCKIKNDPIRILELKQAITPAMPDCKTECRFCNKNLTRSALLNKHLLVCKEREEYHNLLLKQNHQSGLTINNIHNGDNNNTVPFKDRIKVLKGKSGDKLLELLMQHESFNFIYIDASHKCLDVYLDSMLAWKLLKIGGIMAFDDYHFNQGDILNSPYEAIEQFKRNLADDFIIIKEDYRVYLKKIN